MKKDFCDLLSEVNSGNADHIVCYKLGQAFYKKGDYSSAIRALQMSYEKKECYDTINKIFICAKKNENREVMSNCIIEICKKYPLNSAMFDWLIFAKKTLDKNDYKECINNVLNKYKFEPNDYEIEDIINQIKYWCIIEEYTLAKEPIEYVSSKIIEVKDQKLIDRFHYYELIVLLHESSVENVRRVLENDYVSEKVKKRIDLYMKNKAM